MTRAGLALALVCAASVAAAGQPLAGAATAIDGDTIVVAGVHVRLWGIDAPERDQQCGEPAWPCGQRATDAMRAMLTGGVTCTMRDRDRYGRVVAVCRTGAVGDLGGQLVRQGLAIDYRRFSGGAYAGEEAAAKGEHRGIWSGPFEWPAVWRREHRR